MTDRIQVPGVETQTPEGHDAKMAEAFDKAQADALAQDGGQPGAHTPERPEWLPEKFQSPEDLAKAYRELETKLSKGETESKPEDDKANPATVTPEQAEQDLTKVGLDFQALSEEYNTNGTLSDKSYAELEAKGYPRDLVDTWIDGQKAVVAQLQQRVYSVVGGQEQYEQMVTWAANNLTPAEIDAYNLATAHGEASAKLAAQGLYAQFTNARGSEGKLMHGKPANSGAEGFRSHAELTKAMSDPRYKTDPAYRNDVAMKLAASTLF